MACSPGAPIHDRLGITTTRRRDAKQARRRSCGAIRVLRLMGGGGCGCFRRLTLLARCLDDCVREGTIEPRALAQVGKRSHSTHSQPTRVGPAGCV